MSDYSVKIVIEGMEIDIVTGRFLYVRNLETDEELYTDQEDMVSSEKLKRFVRNCHDLWECYADFLLSESELCDHDHDCRFHFICPAAQQRPGNPKQDLKQDPICLCN